MKKIAVALVALFLTGVASAQNNNIPNGGGGAPGSTTSIGASNDFAPVAPGAPTATNSDLLGCRYNSTASDTTANDQGAVGCDQRGGLYVQDGKSIASASLTGTGTLFTVADTSGYGSVSIQVTSAGTGATIAYQVSDDGANWSSTNCVAPNATATASPFTSSTTTVQLVCALGPKQFRAQVTAYSSGTVTAQGTLRKDPVPKQAVQVGISTSGNNVGGYDTSATVCNSGCTVNTLSIAASSHASGASLGGLQTIGFLRTASGSGIVNNVQWLWRTGTNLTAVTVYLFNANPSGSTCTDANAISIAAADVPKLITGSPFVLTPAVVGTGASFSVGAQQLPMSVKNGDATVNVYACVAANATVTPAANDGVLALAGIQD